MDRETAKLIASRKLAEADLYLFSRWMFKARRGYNWQQAEHHRTICDALMRVEAGECRRLIINVAPRYGKTELAVINFISWALGRHPDAEFIHASYSADLAANNAMQTRELVLHDEYRQIFPQVELRHDSKARDHWRTTRGGVVYARGVGGTITGFGAGKERDEFGGAIIIDDAHKPDEALSDVMREAVPRWFVNTLESRKNSPKRTPIIVIGQRLHEEDLPGWLLAGGNGEKWEHICLPTLREDGTALWPEKHTVEMLRGMQEASPFVFSGQYQQSPVPPEGGLFKPDELAVLDIAPEGRYVRAWDLGATTDGDYTVGALIGKMLDGRIIVKDIVRLQGRPDDVERAIIGTANRDGKRVRVSLPQDPGQAGKHQVAYYTRALSGFIVHTSPESGDKITRAEPFASQVNVGSVSMLRADWNNSLVNEMRHFPFGSHDDQVDALSRGFNYLSESRGPMRISDNVLMKSLGRA